jgi:excisionase family DNA binding protein
MQEPIRVYTPALLAQRWQVSERHIRNLIQRGELKAFRLGEKLLRIRVEEVEDYERRNASP